MPPYAEKFIRMSLNRYEQTMFNYWQKQPDELRHWQNKVAAAATLAAGPGEVARSLERDLWDYFIERSQHVPLFRDLSPGRLQRVSLLNLAEYVLRLWGPPTKTKKPRSAQMP
jgi:hypothetical protein